MVLNKQPGLQQAIWLLQQCRAVAWPDSLLLDMAEVHGDQQARHHADTNVQLRCAACDHTVNRQVQQAAHLFCVRSPQIVVAGPG